MKALEHRIPPPLVGLVVAVAMWATGRFTPLWDLAIEYRILIWLVFTFAGGWITYSGIQAFSAAQTTKNPLNPDAATVLVRTGIYRHTRNPMYLGLTIILIGWAVALGAPWALWGPAAFLLFIDRFQVRPEEVSMSRLFGAEYADYQKQVRRWL